MAETVAGATVAPKNYPSNALSTAPIEDVWFFGKKFKGDLRAALMSANLTMSTDQVTEIEFDFIDPDFDMMRDSLFQPGLPVRYASDLYLEVASTDTGSTSGNETVTVRARSRWVRNLKKRRGTHVLKHVSPSEFVAAECKAVGASYICQPTQKRKQVARDKNTSTSEGDEPASSWSTFKRLADEVGFIMFEAAGTIFFGKPTWLVKYGKPVAFEVNWNTGDDDTRTISVPQCSRSEDNADGAVTVSFDLPLYRGKHLRPGNVIKLNGVPTFNGYYLVTSVSFSMLETKQVSIEATTPVNPEAQGTEATSTSKTKSGAKKHKTSKNSSGHKSSTGTHHTSGGGGGGYHGGHSLRALLHYAGFRGHGLEMAIAIVMAESGGNSHAIGDVRLEDAKWGPSVGLFQIRSLKHYNAYGGADRRRNRTRLLGALYNAHTALMISGHGSNWGAWSTYHSGAYKRYYRTGKNYQIKNWNPALANKGSGGSGGKKHKGGKAGHGISKHGHVGSKRAADFVRFALNQAGDRYVWGVEDSIHNPNPSAFDCSELVQWAAGRAGVYVPDGSYNQVKYVHHTSVASAIHTRGALLFLGHPTHHVAISLGNGRTIEALNPGYGVRTMSATHRSFKWTSAGRIPGMKY